MNVYIFRLGEACAHISALLLTIEKAIREEKLEPSCTSIPCEWKKSVKKVPINPEKYSNNFY